MSGALPDSHPRNEAFDAQLQIDHVRSRSDATAIIAVRCICGPVWLGARFHSIRDASALIDLELTQITCYGRSLDALDPGWTALVTLQGSGLHHLEPQPSNVGPKWPIIQGTNPQREPH